MVGPLSVDLHTRGDLHMEIVGGGRGGGEVILVKIHRVGHGTIGENWPRLPL